MMSVLVASSPDHSQFLMLKLGVAWGRGYVLVHTCVRAPAMTQMYKQHLRMYTGTQLVTFEYWKALETCVYNIIGTVKHSEHIAMHRHASKYVQVGYWRR